MDIFEQLKESAAVIKEVRPSYEPILDFYLQVFLVQEQSKNNITLPSIYIGPDLLKIKIKNEMPLIDQSEFLIDIPEAKRLFERLCDLAIDFAPQLSSHARLLKKAELNNTLDLQTLFFAILNNQDSTLRDLSKLLLIPERELAFFGYASVAPSLRVCSESLAQSLSGMPDLKKGYCPICGNLPDIAFLDENGRQFLKCCFCAHEWATPRLGCIFCESNDKDMQHYFFSDEEKEYRVNLCDNCHKYIKVVDLRQMNRAFYPKLEQISTLHLDIMAREQGYSNGTTCTNDVSL